MRILLILAALMLTTGRADAQTAPTTPELIVIAPPGLAAAAARVETLDPQRLASLMRFVGLEHPGEPIRIALEPAGSDVDRATPEGIAGFAHGALGRVVIFPQRAPPYPYGSFDEVLLHELTHVLASRAAGHRPVPRWFAEGLAMVAAGTWGLDDRGWLTLAAVVGPETPLAELDEMFRGGRNRTARAYALSGAFVRDLVERKGADAVARILTRRRLGLSFDESFRRTIGADPETAARGFWGRYSIWYRWVPLVTSSLTLWIGISLLAVWAGVRKRRRRTLLEEMWEAQDELAGRDPSDGDDGDDGKDGEDGAEDEPPPGGWVH